LHRRRPRPTSQAIRATVSAIEANKTLVYGPSDGSLEHNAEDDLVAWNGAGVTLRNFVCEVTFYNPYSTSEGSWDYGIFFRDTGWNQEYRLAVHSDKSWDFGLRDGSNWTNTADGVISDLDISPSGQNTLRLVVKDAQAFFYVNGTYVATLDVSTKQIGGDVAVAIGIWSGDEITGRTPPSGRCLRKQRHHVFIFNIWRSSTELELQPPQGKPRLLRVFVVKK
jgi:hypothetical protein